VATLTIRPHCADTTRDLSHKTEGGEVMAKTIENVIPAGLRDRARKAHLASDHRTGASSRREVRARHRRWLRRQWHVTAVVAALTGFAVAAVHVFVWKPVAPYVIGALLASAAWQIYTMMLETGGVASRRSGIVAEQWTADELRQLRCDDWIVVNHVMLEWRDVDHVLLGPGGFLAIETKFRSDWGSNKQDFGAWAKTAREDAHDVGVRLQQWKTDVQPIVVMWGPEVSTCFPDIFEHDGVTFCPGPQLRQLVGSLPDKVEAGQVNKAFTFLDNYLRTRDPGEVHVSGEIPRTAGQVSDDLLAVGAACMASIVAVLSPVSLPPVGAWSIAVAAAGLIAAIFVRRQWRHSPRMQRVTTAIITTSSGLGVLLAVTMAIKAIK